MAKTPPAWMVQGMLKMGMSLPTPKRAPYPDNWDQMTGDEKYAVLSKAFVSTEGRDFKSPEIAETYRRRAQRWVDVLALKEPDRIPNFTLTEGYVAQFGGITEKDVWYDSKKSVEATLKFQKEFNLEYTVRSIVYSGRAFDTLGFNIARWPGSAIAEQALRPEQSFQYVEKEYMVADEYDLLIADPTDYLLTRFIPRTCTNLAGLKDLPSSVSATTVTTMAFFLMGFAMGPAKESFKVLTKAADLFIQDMLPAMMGKKKMESQYGTPALIGGMGIVPFDIVGDTLRGTTGVMLDMYRYPDKLVAACEALTPTAIRMATSGIRMGGAPFVFIPLHKGADGFMSTEQFEKFYWPSFRQMLLGIIDAGLVPIPFVEGSYDQRLDFIAEKGDLPTGKTAWLFDRTDMKAAKEKIGSWACIGGNVPASLFMSGEPKTMDEYCKELIDTCASGGGFFLAPGVIIDNAIDENFRAYLASAKKYGVY
jgi:Uroporphyrinogen decarboxylase (URO-D)